MSFKVCIVLSNLVYRYNTLTNYNGNQSSEDKKDTQQNVHDILKTNKFEARFGSKIKIRHLVACTYVGVLYLNLLSTDHSLCMLNFMLLTQSARFLRLTMSEVSCLVRSEECRRVRGPVLHGLISTRWWLLDDLDLPHLHYQDMFEKISIVEKIKYIY